MADARDLKSLVPLGTCGFESRLGQWIINGPSLWSPAHTLLHASRLLRVILASRQQVGHDDACDRAEEMTFPADVGFHAR
jgi:hypothetical protein